MGVLLLPLGEWANIAVIATGLGVLLVFFQVRQGRRASQVQLVTGMTTMMLEIDKAFIEYPGMRPFFKEGVSPPEAGTTREQAQAIAMAMANALDHVVAHLGYMKRDARWSWEKYIADLYEQSPVFADLLDDHSDWWPYLWSMVREWRISGRLGTCTSCRPAAAQSN